MALEFELTDYHWHETCVSSTRAQLLLGLKGQCKCWHGSYVSVIKYKQQHTWPWIEGDTSTKSLVYIMSAMDL